MKHCWREICGIFTCFIPILYNPAPQDAWKWAAFNFSEKQQPGGHQKEQTRDGALSNPQSQRNVIIYMSDGFLENYCLEANLELLQYKQPFPQATCLEKN